MPVSYTHLDVYKRQVLVDLRCDNSLMKTMVDRFGEDVTTLAYDMTSFRVQTEVSASPTFFGWVFGFSGKVQILAPESVKEQYRPVSYTHLRQQVLYTSLPVFIW